MKTHRLLVAVFASMALASWAGDTEIIVESFSDGLNAQAFSKDGKWTESTAKSTAAGVQASKSVFNDANTDPGSAKFTPEIPVAGKYEVFITYPTSGNASDIKHTVVSADGTKEIPLTQNGREMGNAPAANQWHSLGIFTFNQGTEGYVEVADPLTGAKPLANEPNARIYADAVKFVPQGITLPADYVNKGKTGSDAGPAVAAPITPTEPTATTTVAASAPPALPALPATTAATPAAPAGAAIPGLPALPGTPAATPSVPVAGLPALPATPAAANGGLPALPAATANAATALPGLPSTPGASIPALPEAPAQSAAGLPSLPASASQPGVPALPGMPPVEISTTIVTAQATPMVTPDLPSLAPVTPTPQRNIPSPADTPVPAVPGSLPSGPLESMIPTFPPADSALPPAPVAPGLPGAPSTPQLSAAANPSNLQWMYDFGAALNVARSRNRKVMVFFTAPGNSTAQTYETQYFTHPTLRQALNNYVLVKVDFTKNTRLGYTLGIFGAGIIVVTDSAGNVTARIEQLPATPTDLVKMMASTQPAPGATPAAGETPAPGTAVPMEGAVTTTTISTELPGAPAMPGALPGAPVLPGAPAMPGALPGAPVIPTPAVPPPGAPVPPPPPQ